MDQISFHQWLLKAGRTEEVAERVIRLVTVFADFLAETGELVLDSASPEDLEAFVAFAENSDQLPTYDGIHPSANSYLWAIRYYYQYADNLNMESYASQLRQARIKRRPFKLGEFRDVDPHHIVALESAGIKNINQMLKRGKTAAMRQRLADETGIPTPVILELVKLSDLARIPGIKSIRARLYHDAGIDTMHKLAAAHPDELRAELVEWVEATGFDGIAPLPAEIRFSINRARELPKIVEYA